MRKEFERVKEEFAVDEHDFDLDEMMRKGYRDAILKADSERSAYSPESEIYQALSKKIEEFQKSLAYLRYKDPR